MQEIKAKVVGHEELQSILFKLILTLYDDNERQQYLNLIDSTLNGSSLPPDAQQPSSNVALPMNQNLDVSSEAFNDDR